MIEYVSDARTVRAYLALPPAGTGPGVLVLHAWWGLNAVIEDLCDRLASQGFVALAPDLYEGRIGTTVGDAEALAGSLDETRTETLLVSATEYLRTHPATTTTRLAVVGFSLGAAWASRLAVVLCPGDIGAVVLFYGIDPGIRAAEYAPTPVAFQLHLAPGDPYAEDEVRLAEVELKASGRPYTIHRYDGTMHWFFESDRPEYDAAAAEVAFARMVAFLKEQTM